MSEVKQIPLSKLEVNNGQICRAAELPFYIKADLRQFADGVELSENEMNMDFLNL